MNPPPAAYAAALAGFEQMTVHRLAALLRHGTPHEAWAVAVGQARPTGLVANVLGEARVRDAWRRSAVRRAPDQVWQRCLDAGIDVVVRGDERYPDLLTDDPAAPPVLFVRGDLGLLAGRRAGVVGTRNATAAGRDAANRLGQGLAEAGVHVVSGLAKGIDGEAHRGALRTGGPGRPIGVVASGLDVVYPRVHVDLWADVARDGLLLSESPPGTAPEAYRFPLRNRIIAALSEVVVVVESRERGGSLITCNEAAERGIPVMAVPGSVHNRAAAGSNNLLREGSAVAVDASDVLIALSIDHRRTAAPAEQRARPRGADLPVYEACAGAPRTVEGITLATGLPLVEVAMAVARLEGAGWLAQADGWFETIGAPLR